jgi:hypothetical protein
VTVDAKGKATFGVKDKRTLHETNGDVINWMKKRVENLAYSCCDATSPRGVFQSSMSNATLVKDDDRKVIWDSPGRMAISRYEPAGSGTVRGPVAMYEEL